MSYVLPGDARRTRGSGEPWLVWDDRPNLNAQGRPGLHALICGVSAYPNLPGPGDPPAPGGLGMRRLTATASTAYLMLDWLIRAHQSGQLHLPLATCRVLLSPTEAELTNAPPLGNSDRAARPTLKELGVPGCGTTALQDAALAWRHDASTSPEAGTLFYFAGHGIQRGPGDQVLLLEEFGGPGSLLRHGVNVKSLRDGMAPSQERPNIARTQFYFVDACRNLPEEVLSYAQLQANWILDAPASGLDNRRAPIFYAALPDGQAQAVPNQQTLFNIALLRCLTGAAAQPPRDDGEGRVASDWHVTSQSLNRGLKAELDDLNRTYGGSQTWLADGFGEDTVLCYLKDPPQVSTQFVVDPVEAVPATKVRVTSMIEQGLVFDFPSNGSPHPYQQKLAAGQYQAEATVPPPYRADRKFCAIEPLGSRRWRLRVQP